MNALDLAKRLKLTFHFDNTCPTGWLMECPNCREKNPAAGPLVAFNQLGDDIVIRCYGGCPGAELLEGLRILIDDCPVISADQWMDREAAKGHERTYLQSTLAKRLPLPKELRQRGNSPETDDGLVCVADVQPEPVTWLWKHRIPRGKITLFDGDPGLGKSTLTLELAARISAGLALPGEEEAAPPAGVLVLSDEDEIKDTIRPRLEAAGANIKRVFVWKKVGQGDDARTPSFPRNLTDLEERIKMTGATLVIIDPLMAFLGGKIDSHKDQDVRRALGGLARVAESTGAAIVIVRHMNKTRGAPALYRGSGSIGIVGAARSALLVAKDPDDKNDEGLRILAPLKSNLGPPAPALRFQVTGAPNGSSMVRWLGTTAHKADGLVSDALPQAEQDEHDEGASILRQILESAGGRLESVRVKQQAREAGISERTLWRVKSRVGATVGKEGKTGPWFWSLAPSSSTGTLGRDGSLLTKPDTYNSANDSANPSTTGTLGRVQNPAILQNSANSANSANSVSLLKEGINIENDWKAANSANSANHREDHSPETNKRGVGVTPTLGFFGPSSKSELAYTNGVSNLTQRSKEGENPQ